MELEIKTTIYIDVDDIIGGHGLDFNSTDAEIEEAIVGYVCQLDDSEYYLIGDTEEQKIFAEIRARVGEQITLK